ncbi:MAG: DNRLRE domain-containing protein [Candidatus Aminicenantes bacterium]|nr:DNRLRE domain-containing protein [Candidatus Aminicenantes bacterium]
MNRVKMLYRNKQTFIPKIIRTSFLAMLLFCSIAIAQKPLDPEYLSKLDMFENLRGLENSWITGGANFGAMAAIREMDPNNNLTIVDSKTWIQPIKGGPNFNDRTIGTNSVLYVLLKSNNHSPAKLRDIVAYIFKDGRDSFSDKYKKAAEASNQRHYQEMPDRTSPGPGAGYEPGSHSGIGLSGNFIDVEFDPDNQEKREKHYFGIYQIESTVTGTGRNKIKTDIYKRTKGRVLTLEMREKVVTHNQYIMIVGVNMRDLTDFTPREDRAKDGWVQSYDAARPFPDDLWQPILSKLNPAISTPAKFDEPKPGKVVKDNVNDLPPGAAGHIMSIMGSKAGKIFNETTGKILKKGDIIYFGDVLTTHDVMVKIILNCYPDAPLVMLKSNTKVRLEQKQKIKQGGIFNFFGKLFFKGNGRDHQGYKIVTSNCAASIEGTSFETAYDPNTSKTTVSVFEGTVRMECTNGVINPVIVNAGMQATMDNNCNHTLSILDPDNNTAAKAGWEIDDEPGTINNIDDRQDGDIVRIEPNSDSHVYAYSYRNWNKSNWGKYENIGAGWNPTGGEKRAFLKFDLAGIDPNSVKKATLKLYHNHTGGGNAVDIGVYRVMSPWQEGSGTYHSGQTEKTASYGEISWDNQPSVDRYPVVYFNPGQEINKWIEVDVTSLIKAWLTGVPNHGMAIKVVENYLGKSESQYGFRSREFEEIDKRPVLVLSGSGGLQEPKGDLGGDVIIDEDSVSPEPEADTKEAYQQYISAYNKLTKLMAQGEGDTPAVQAAYKAYKEAKDKYEAILKAQDMKEEKDKLEIGKVTEPDEPDSTQTNTQKKQAQDKKPDEPTGTGPEYDCEYGLPKRDGANGELQLTPGELPSGLHLDDFANMNKACEVHQWIMQGSERMNRIELNISVWNERADGYYKWKHGMLGTGQFNQTDLPIGNKQLYVEEKAGCNKQLIAQVGNYLVEMHRPPVEGLTQQTDPISRGQFVALAKACENRIEAVAGIPPKQMLDDNPSDFRWEGTSVVWPVSFVNGTLKVQGAGRPTWGTDWVGVDTEIKGYRGEGTGAGPVVIYTKDNKSWTVVTLNHNTGGKGNIRRFDTRVSIMKAGDYGATLRAGGACYDYSWNHLKEIDCGSGMFTPGGTQNKPGTEDPKTIQDKKDPKDVTPTTGTGGQTGTKVGGSGTAPQVQKLPALPPEPDSVQTPPVDVHTPVPPPQWIRRFWPGLVIYKVGTVTTRGVYDIETGEDCPSWWDISDESEDIGHFEGNDFHAEKPGYGWFICFYEYQGYDDFYKKVVTKSTRAAEAVRVIPGEQKPPSVKPWSTSSEELLSGRVYVMKKTGLEYVSGVRISLNREDGRHLDTESKTKKNQAGQNEEGHYGFTGIELGSLPEGIYTILCYKQTGTVSTDLWQKTGYRVRFPLKSGEKFVQDIELWPAGQKWNKFNIEELDKRIKK